VEVKDKTKRVKMVQLDRVQGQRGHLIIHVDGTIISSSGELASSETAAEKVLHLVQQKAPVPTISSGGPGPAGDSHHHHHHNQHNHHHAGVNGGGDSQEWKWNRITVDFGDHSYVACMSNRKIHVVKRDHHVPDADHING